MGILEKDKESGSTSTLVKAYFLWMGITSLLGYNAILGSLDYFAGNFSTYNVYFYLPLPSMVSFNIISLVMPSIAGIISFPLRVSLCLISMLAIVVLFPLVTVWLSQSGTGFTAILILSLIWGVFGQVFNSSLLGLASTLNRGYIVSYNIGSSASGIIIIILRIFATLVYNDDTDDSAIVYFLSAGVLTGVAVILHVVFLRSNHYQEILEICARHHTPHQIFQQEDNYSEDPLSFCDPSSVQSEQIIPLQIQQQQPQQISGGVIIAASLPSYSPRQTAQSSSSRTNTYQNSQSLQQLRGTSLQQQQQQQRLSQNTNQQKQSPNSFPSPNRESSSVKSVDLLTSQLVLDEPTNAQNAYASKQKLTLSEQLIQQFEVAKILSYLPVFMMISNICANMMYPAVSLKSQINGISYTWSCIWIVFLHNFANVAGKFLTNIRVLYSQKQVYVLILVRFLHFGIFIVNASETTSFLAENWIIILNILIFSFSAGYTDGALFVLAAEKMQTGAHKEQGGFIMAFSLTFGIMIGIFLAMPFQAL